jgi:hypothetical protein
MQIHWQETREDNLCTYTHACIHIYTYTYTYTHIHSHTRTGENQPTSLQMQMHRQETRESNLYTCTHTYTYTHTHRRKPADLTANTNAPARDPRKQPHTPTRGANLSITPAPHHGCSVGVGSVRPRDIRRQASLVYFMPCRGLHDSNDGRDSDSEFWIYGFLAASKFEYSAGGDGFASETVFG